MELAYKAEYEHTDITLAQLLDKYDISLDDLPSHKEWLREVDAKSIGILNEPTVKIVKPKAKPRKKKVIDKILDSIPEVIRPEPLVEALVPKVLHTETKQELVPEIVEPDNEPTATEKQLVKISEFKEFAMDHCLHFMKNDAKFSEVKEFKDIVSIVDSLEKSYQKIDPDAGKTTINVLVQNLMERFQDDC